MLIGRVLSCLTALTGLMVCNLTIAYAGLPDVIERVKPTIVGIGSYNATRAQQLVLLGTGFAVADGQHIVTNYHVVSGTLDQDANDHTVVIIGYGENAKIYRTSRVAIDTRHDLILLQFNGPALPALKLNSARRVREGETYAFTGYPIGAVLGLYPVTHRGIISAIIPNVTPMHSGTELSAAHIKQLRDESVYAVYQLDAVAYPGNSGSPLYDLENGDVVGVLNSVLIKGTRESALANPSGISYVIPAHFIERLVNSLKR